jgi:transaldolase
VKVPFLWENLPIIGQLNRHGIKVNATAIMTPEQAFMAEKAGAYIVSFFYRRMCDHIAKDMVSHDKEPATEYAAGDVKYYADSAGCRIICGSIRKPEDILMCWSAGADYVTAPLKVIKEMTRHPKTDEAIELFEKDIANWLNPRKEDERWLCLQKIDDQDL